MSKNKLPPLDSRTLRWASKKAQRRMRLCFGDSRPEYKHLDILSEELLTEARKIEKKNKIPKVDNSNKEDAATKLQLRLEAWHRSLPGCADKDCYVCKRQKSELDEALSLLDILRK